MLDGPLASFFDSGGFEWWPFASAALAAVVAGAVLLYLKLHVAAATKAREDERRELKTAIAGLGLQIANEGEERRKDLARESDERRNSVNKEGDIRRIKDEELGRDLVAGLGEIRVELAYERGAAGKPKPRFGKGQGDD